MPEITKAPRPWWKTLKLILLPLCIGNIINGILMKGFVGGVLVGMMAATLIFEFVTALADP